MSEGDKWRIAVTGLWIAPIAPPFVFLGVFLLSATFARANEIEFNPASVVVMLPAVMLLGVPVCYILSLILGFPILCSLKAINKLTGGAMVSAGVVLAATACCVIFVLLSHGEVRSPTVAQLLYILGFVGLPVLSFFLTLGIYYDTKMKSLTQS